MKTKGRYQQKMDQGLVPHRYDHDSRSFMEGAWKNWPHNRDPVTRQITYTQEEHERNVRTDLVAFANRQTRFHQFTM